MSISKNNLENTEPHAASTEEASSRVAIWGLPLAALVLAIAALLLAWFQGENLGVPDGMPRTLVLVSIPVLLVVVVIIHLVAISTGAYASAARLLRFQTGDKGAASAMARPLKRDARLQRMAEELSVSHGWFWRRRLRWLLVSGNDERVDQVAPGLKQAGVIIMGEVVLLHASPDRIEAAKWLAQIRRLRRRLPVDTIVHVAVASDRDFELPRTLSGIAVALGWAAPVTFLHPVQADGSQPERFEAVGAFLPNDARGQARSAAVMLSEILGELEQRTAEAGVRMSGAPHWVTYMLEISKYIGDHAERMTANVRTLAASNWLRAPLAGVMFAPVFPGVSTAPVFVIESDEAEDRPVREMPANDGTREQPLGLMPIWQNIAEYVPRYRGRRTGWHWPDVIATCALVGAIGWTVMLVVSGLGNRALIREAQTAAAAALAAAPGTPQALRAQLVLQKQIDTLESRHQHGVPWYLRGGLSRNDDLLDALWLPYQTVAIRNLRQPAVQALEGQLVQLSQVRADEQQSREAQQQAYDRLKAYLMLATPAHTDPPFLKAQLLDVWPAPAGMRVGEWLDTSQQLAGFWSDHLEAHPDWRISASMPVVTQMRSTLINQIGLAASDDVLYQQVLDKARGKYADISLATLLAGADAHSLFTTTQTVPGIFTRAAWEGMIEKSIDDAVKQQHVEGDWVLTGGEPTARATATAVEGTVDAARTALNARRDTDSLRRRLRERYFTDYTAAWATLLNSFRWVPATSFSGVIDQLTRLTDAQTSPLLAVMKSVQYQGEAGRASQALTDTLVRKAQGLLGGSDSNATQSLMANPLDRAFGPLLALMGEPNPAAASGNTGNGQSRNAGGFNGVSLSRVLTADTTVRLKLQQIQSSPDAQAMARSLAQAVFQGKLSDLSQARDDAALTAASLGAQWAGFGQTMFVQPLDSAWQAVLQPAAASLNDAWRASVAAPFNTAMNGRYPFFDTQSDASFAELGRYARPDTGLIARFITTQLAGVLKLEGDQWVPNELAPQSLQFDPKFLAAIRQLSLLGAQAYAQGDAGYRFEIMPLPSENVTRTELDVDGKPVVYFNQQESWTALTWPGNGLNGRTGLMWQMVNAGLRLAFDATGDWAFLRLLAQAKVRPLDSTRYELTWDQPDAAPLRYVLRTQIGAGPLDLLKLRDFRMPEKIFVVGKPGVISTLPPLPPELQP